MVFFWFLVLHVVLLLSLGAMLLNPATPPSRMDRSVARDFMQGLRFGIVETADGETGYDTAISLLSPTFAANDGVIRLVEEIDDIVATHGLILSCKPRPREFGNVARRGIAFDVVFSRSAAEPVTKVATVWLLKQAGDRHIVDGLDWKADS